MNAMKTLGVATLVLALAACGGAGKGDTSTTQEHLDAVPDAEGLALEIQDEGSGSALAIGSSEDALATFTPPTTDELVQARADLRKLNAVVRGVLDRVNDLIGAQPNALPGEVRVFGPKDLPAAAPGPFATFRLTTKKKGVGHFGFKIEAKKLTDPEAAASYALVAAGDIVRSGERARRGRGTFALDADALHAVNATAYPATGKLLASFAHTGANGKALSYRLVSFDADGAGTAYQPVTGKIAGHRSSVTGVTRVRLIGFRDLVGPSSANPFHDELVVSHFGWNPDAAVHKARAFTVATNYKDASGATHGDVADLPPPNPNAFWLGRACWDTSTTPATKRFQDWTQCRWGETAVACVLGVIGDPSRHVQVTGTTWAADCAGVSDDPPPTTTGTGPADDNTEDGAEKTPDEPPSTVPPDPTT